MEQQPMPEKQKLLALYRQFLNLSPDTDIAGRLIFLGPDGALIATAALSEGDIAAASEALAVRNAAKTEMEEALRPADTLPLVSAHEVTEVVSGFEALLKGEGGQA